MRHPGALPLECLRIFKEIVISTDTDTKTPARQFALAAAELAANTRCESVVLLDLRGRSPVTEFFLIATGTSPRQMRTVVDELRDLGKKMGFQAWRMDGYDSARWIVLDCVAIVAHVFDQDSRDFYDLELLWGDCPRIDWRNELGLPPEPERAEEAAAVSGVDNSGVAGDPDVDEDAEIDEPVVVEIPDESTGSNSVEFVEIDPPGRRRQRGRVVYPTTVEGVEEATMEEMAMSPLRSSGLEDAEDIELEEAPARRATRPAKKVTKKKSSARAAKPAKAKPATKAKPVAKAKAKAKPVKKAARPAKAAKTPGKAAKAAKPSKKPGKAAKKKR